MDRWDRNMPRGRPAHAEGTTRCAYTPDGDHLITVGVNNTIRIYKTTGDDEPTNIDDCPENNTCVAASSDFFVVGAEDGTVSLYSITEAKFERFLTRCPLPVRDVSISPDGKWCAIASDETTAKIIGTEDTMKFHSLTKHGVASKHVAFSPNGKTVGFAGTDGSLVFYSIPGNEPEVYRKVDGIGGDLDPESAASGAIVWFPDGRGFGVPTPMREIQVVSSDGWNKERKFPDGHLDRISAFACSPNGALLATAGLDSNFLIWDTRTQNAIDRRRIPDVIDMAWHPKSKSIAFTTSQGELHVHHLDPQKFGLFLEMGLQPIPYLRDPSGPLGEVSGNARRNGTIHKELAARPRRDSLGSLSDSLLDDAMDDYGDLDDFVVDDDGAGYAPGLKRGAQDDLDGEHASKRRLLMLPQTHDAFQPGSTPWRGNRKYLCLNLVGVIWTVDQGGHNSVTVEFYDHEFHRDFHFTDTYCYDKACLNENGALFSCPPKGDTPATIFYRPHETWTQRSDWRTELPEGESIHAMSLSESFVTVVTSANYVRVYTLFGIPFKVYRPKSSPVVTCASWRNYVLTVGNGSVGADGRTKLLYSIYNTKRDELCQNEDTVALPDGASLTSVFFSDHGDPYIYDSTGTLLTLLHWRQPSRAIWAPLLDTKLLPRLASGKKDESYFPIAVADNKFHCIILKGGDKYPYFPRPLLSEFEFSVPLLSAAPKQKQPKQKKQQDGEAGLGSDLEDDEESDKEDENDDDRGDAESQHLIQQFLLKGIQASQLQDLTEATSASYAQRTAISRLNVDIDKVLLQLLAVECREGEERGLRALEVVSLMRDRTGRMLGAAGKVAERYGRTILGEKIRELGEERVGRRESEDEDDF